MKRTLTLATLLVLPIFIMAQNDIKVALLETLNGDKRVQVEGIEMNMVRGELRKAITNQNGYKAFTRTDIDRLMKEHGFQNSGMVSDDQRKQLGKMSGADYICVSTLTKSNMQFYLEAYLIDVETGEISNPATQYGMLKDGTYANLFQLCQDLAQELIGNVGSETVVGGGGGNSNSNKEYTETAFDINMRMIYVDGGTFMMGCTDEQSKCDEDEKNVRRVTVDGFYIGMMEISQAQWEKVMGESMDSVVNRLRTEYRWVAEYDEPGWWKEGDTVWPSPFCEGEEHLKVSRVGQNYPICLIRQYEALEFCKKLSEKTGKKYTLPTEAQWEYAARGGNKASRGYNGGNINDIAWYSGNSKGLFHVCGSKGPNALGIYDMLGNVSEWCLDFYVESYLNYETVNPTGPKEADREMYPDHVIRGGCYESDAKDCRVSRRQYDTEQAFSKWLGFRVVCIP